MSSIMVRDASCRVCALNSDLSVILAPFFRNHAERQGNSERMEGGSVTCRLRSCVAVMALDIAQKPPPSQPLPCNSRAVEAEEFLSRSFKKSKN